MKKAIALAIIVSVLIAISAGTACAGWKENYRERYSKQNIDPNSEKAKKIRSLCNFDFTYHKKKTPEERAALGEEPKTTLSENLMPWKRNKSDKDKFEGYTSNFSSKMKEISMDEEKMKTGRTFTGCVRTIGKAITTGSVEDSDIK